MTSSSFSKLLLQLNRRLFTVLEEPITLDKLESPNPFLPATQVEFTFKEIAFTINNEVTLLYPSHHNQEYFKDVSNFISKCYLKEAFTRAPTQYKEYVSEFWYTTKTLEDSKVWVSTPTCGVKGDIGGKTGGLDQISNKDATILYCMANKVQVDYAKLIWEDLINKQNMKTREKIVPYLRFIFLLLEHMIPKYNNEELTINPTQVFSVYICTLKPNQPKEPFFTTHIKAIYKLDVHAVSKAPKPSSQTDKDMDEGTKNYSFDHIFAGSNPSVLVDKTKSAGDGLNTTHTDSCKNEESRANDTSKKIKLKDLLEFLKDTRSAFFTPDSPQDDLIIVTDESKEEEANKEDTHDTSHDVPKDTLVLPHPSPKSAQIQELMAQVQLLKSKKDELEQQKATAKAEVASLKVRSSYPDVNQLTTLLVTFLKPELSKLLASHNFANCLPTNLKEHPSKFTELSREIKEIKQHVKDMEIKLPRDLKEILTKLETFTSTISSLTS
ncbi:hypothetical protein Tco_1039621 [Tanacetum coccineum]